MLSWAKLALWGVVKQADPTRSPGVPHQDRLQARDSLLLVDSPASRLVSAQNVPVPDSEIDSGPRIYASSPWSPNAVTAGSNSQGPLQMECSELHSPVVTLQPRV